MSDSDDWASASDSELQDREVSAQKSSTRSGATATKEGTVADDALRIEPTDEGQLGKDDYEESPKLSAILSESDSQAQASTTRDCLVNATIDKSPDDLLKETPPTYDENKLLCQEQEVSSKELKTGEIQNVSHQQLTSNNVLGAVASENDPSSSAWGGWGSSWLSKAATSVASSAHTLANSTEHGLSSLLSSVESSFGIPTPESMATHNTGEKSSAALGLKEIAQRLRDEQNHGAQSLPSKSQPTPLVGGNGAETLTQTSPLPTSSTNRDEAAETNSDDSASFFASYGISLTSKLVTGGLDTLENLGKKTMNYLSEGDPGLRSKRTYVQDQIHSLTNEISNEVSVAEEQLQATKVVTSFHAEFEKLQGYVYLEALEILSSECEAKHRLRMHSISARREEGASDEASLLKESFEISFDTESPSCHWDELFPSVKGLVGLGRMHSTVGELGQCCDEFDTFDTSHDVLLPHLNLSMQLLAKLSSQYVMTARKVSELCLAQQLRVGEALTHSRQLALLAYQSIDCVTTRIALVEVSDDVIGNKFILDMNSAVTYIQDSFSLMRSILIHASSA